MRHTELHVCCVVDVKAELVLVTVLKWSPPPASWGPVAKVGQWLFCSRRHIDSIFCQDYNELLRPAGRKQRLTFVQSGSVDGRTEATTVRVTSSLSSSPSLSRSACDGSRSSGCTPPGWWRWGRCSPAWRRALWRKSLVHSSSLQPDPLERKKETEVKRWSERTELIGIDDSRGYIRWRKDENGRERKRETKGDQGFNII